MSAARARPWRCAALAAVLTALALLAACQPHQYTPAPPEGTPPRTAPAVVQTQVVEATSIVTQPAPVPTGTPVTAEPTTDAPTPVAAVEYRVVEVEWPPQMRLGDSDVIRLSIVPDAGGYVVTSEFPEHRTLTDTLRIEQPPGHDLAAIARLDAAGFATAPEGEQVQMLSPGQPATWRWTLRARSPGQHRVALVLRLRWTPQAGSSVPAREAVLYDRALTVRVLSFMGMTAREAGMLGALGLALGSTLSLPLAAHLLGPRRAGRLRALEPNPRVSIETPPGVGLIAEERRLLQALFGAYDRLVIEAEFLSGYSGARTLLAQPIRADGRADAHTIAKLGERDAMLREHANYEAFVKDSLPPVTARIQALPVAARGPGQRRAALRYTFIGEPGQAPVSLRQALLREPDPGLLFKLFDTFGPGWWMQRQPYTFRLALEYDRMMPTHYVLAPADTLARAAPELDGRLSAAQLRLEAGDVVRLRHVRVAERRPDGVSLSLVGAGSAPGQPPLRLRWLSADLPRGPARVVATRESLLRETVAGFDLHGLPDPLARLPRALAETVSGTRSTIHGDLNLENILVGPGGFVWLIDFAQTRSGHPLFDFAFLTAGLLSQVISPLAETDAAFLNTLQQGHPLLAAMRDIAGRCLFNPAQPREFDLALYAACMGSLKFVNLDMRQKHHLYLAAAWLNI